MIFFIRDYILGDMLIYLVVGLFLYCTIRGIVLRNKKEKIQAKKECLNLIFVLYLIVLFSETIMPMWCTSTIDGVTKIEIIRNIPRFNFIPFRSIYYFFTTLSSDLVSYNSYLNLFANIFLLFPFGALFPLVWKKYRKNTILFGFALSVTIEILQIIPGRSTDIDDVILNVLGCAMGYGFTHLLLKRISDVKHEISN